MKNTTTEKNRKRFIDPEILSYISNLQLLARTVVEGFISGLHKSPYKGFSIEFMEYRPYIPGDDLMHIDWKLYGRTDRYYVKEFEEETNTSCNILLDISRSMGYTSTEVTKLEYGFYLAASLAYFISRQKDSVGISFFDDKIVQRIPPKSTTGHLNKILDAIEQTELGAQTEVGKPFHELAEMIKKRGFMIIISDLLDEPEAIIDGLKHLKFNGNEVVLFHILDPQEKTFNFDDIIELEDMETGEKMLLMSEEAQEVYLWNLETFQTTLKTECSLLGVDYEVLTTDTPLDFALFQYLAARSRRQ